MTPGVVEMMSVELAAQALLHDLHVEKAEESASEAEAEGDGRLVVERERRVVQVQLLKPLAHLLELVGGHRVDAAEHGGAQLLEAGQRLLAAEARRCHGVADLDLGGILHRSHEVSGLAGLELGGWLLGGREYAHLVESGGDARAHELHGVAALHGAIHDSHVRDHAAELVEHAVEHERAKRGVDAARLGGRDALDDGLKHVGAANAGLCGDEKRIVHGDGEDVLHLLRDAGHVRAGKVHLVQHRHDLEVGVLREVRVRHRLRLHALRGVDHQKRAFAGAHGTAHLVCEVHMSRGVDEVEEVLLSVLGVVEHRDGVALDGDAALALEVHGVERLLLELALRNGLRELQNAVRERGLAVVHMRDDAEIADVV